MVKIPSVKKGDYKNEGGEGIYKNYAPLNVKIVSFSTTSEPWDVEKFS
jgi:hypothetical protein